MSNDTFNENIKRIIKESGKTQTHIAGKCGYSNTQLCDILHGRKVVKPEDIAKLCKALEVTPNELFGYPSPQMMQKSEVTA